MKNFTYIDAGSVEEAVAALRENKAKILAGGTDLLGAMKDDIYPEFPRVLVNIKNIPGLSYIREEDGYLKIGALTTLRDIAENDLIREKYTCLAQAAENTASVLLRTVATIGGNLCQNTRCWYYWGTHNIFPCLRKEGGLKCFAFTGENEYHSIYGATNRCAAVNPSDTAPAVAALNAEMVTSKRVIPVDEFFAVGCEKSTVMDRDELLVEIRIPEFVGKSAFMKMAPRKTIDFPTVNCACSVQAGKYRVYLNAVYGIPKKVAEAEALLEGKELTEELAREAGEAAGIGAKPMKQNKYKVQIAKVMVERTLLQCR